MPLFSPNRSHVAVYLVLGLLGSVSGVEGQRRDTLISLRSRVFPTRAGIDSALPVFARSAPGGRLHVILQFHSRPSLVVKGQLASRGVRLLDPLPERAYFASVPADTALARAILQDTLLRVRWIGPVTGRDKISPRLSERRRSGVAGPGAARVLLLVQFFLDAPERVQRDVLSRHDARVLSRVGLINGWEVVLPPGQIDGLASDDRLQWVTEIPGPPQADNDGVRSAAGVNADAVLAPSAYGLSGAGVTIGQFEAFTPSVYHPDFAGRITISATPFGWARTHAHDESGAVTGAYDDGEVIYIDRDDSGTVTVGDTRLTPTGTRSPGPVSATDPDVSTPLVLFERGDQVAAKPPELFYDAVVDGQYTAGEAIYRDADFTGTVTAADIRVTGSAPADASLRPFPTVPHWHATMVAGTIMGSGSRSVVEGGTVGQWKGVAPAAVLRSYVVQTWQPTSVIAQTLLGNYDAATSTFGVVISVNAWGPAGGHCHQMVYPDHCYDMISELFDHMASGRDRTGGASGMSRVFVTGSSGNAGYPEAHTDEGPTPGRYDSSEAIYMDVDGDGEVSSRDWMLNGLPPAVAGTKLELFDVDEMHTEVVSDTGSYEAGEGIYVDTDRSGTVTEGDVRLAVTGWAGGSVVNGSDADVAGGWLRPFKYWRTVRGSNGAKNTLQLGASTADLPQVPAFSSRGPTDDGRLKPDLLAPGHRVGGAGGITSTYPGGGYWSTSGTSLSTAAAGGAAALLTEWYKTACQPAGPTPDAVKALLLHAAADVAGVGSGTFIGPDYTSGFGSLRLREAVDLVQHHARSTASALGSTDRVVTIGTARSLKVTLAWNDPPWTPNALPLPGAGILHNDLDLIVMAPDGTQHSAWVVRPEDPWSPATRQSFPSGTTVPDAARDRLNPVEQVVVENPAAGDWIIRVEAKRLDMDYQDYTVVSEALPPEGSPCAASPPADVWIRDNAGDTGVVPSSGDLWLGPDLWNRTSADGATTHQNPVFGQTNYFYVNVRNASSAMVRATSVEVWIAGAALGLSWPNDFTYVGRLSVPNLGPGEVRQMGPLAWDPPSPTPSDHYCAYIRVLTSQDPITITEGPWINVNARTSNNIAYRNLTIVTLASSRTLSLQVRNVDPNRATVDILLNVPPELLSAGEVLVTIPSALDLRRGQMSRDRVQGVERSEGRLSELLPVRPSQRGNAVTYRVSASEATLPGFTLNPREAERLMLTFRSTAPGPASYDVDVSQRINGQIVGGIRYVVRVGSQP